MLVFRVDASIEIGTGHVMRCLALAKSLSAAGEKCQFICREHPGHLIDVIESQGFKVIRLPPPLPGYSDNTKRQTYAGWLGVSWQQDAEECKNILQKLHPDRVILDHYALDEKWQLAALPPQTKLMVIDDLADRPHHCDILLDQNLGRQKQDYDLLVPNTCIRLIGPQYALLRPEFGVQREFSLSRRQNWQLKNILISMGGIDKDNATGKIMKVLAQCELPAAIKITIILGANAPWVNDVFSLASQMPFQTELLSDVSNMAEQMANADLAIGSAGGTSWERCCLGLPTLLLVIAENQIESTKALADQKFAISLGELNKDDWPTELISAIALMQEPDHLSNLSQAAASVCDGNGCAKVSENIITSQLSIRKATLEDSRDIWNWRYANGAERYYQNPSKPEFSEHEIWFEKALLDNNRLVLMVCKNRDAIAHVRFDLFTENHETASVAICLSGQYKGKNLAYPCLQLAINFAYQKGIQKFEAVIHDENFASIKLFSRLGFKFQSKTEKLGTYILKDN